MREGMRLYPADPTQVTLSSVAVSPMWPTAMVAEVWTWTVEPGSPADATGGGTLASNSGSKRETRNMPPDHCVKPNSPDGLIIRRGHALQGTDENGKPAAGASA